MPSAVGRSPAALPGRVVQNQPQSPLQGIFYGEQFEANTLAQIFDNSVGSTASIDTAHAHSGTKALLIHQTGSAASSIRNVPGAPTVVVERFWVYLTANPTAQINVFRMQLTTSTTTGCIARIATGGTLQVGFNGGTFAQSAAPINLNAWNSVDIRIDTRTSTYLADSMLNGVALAQATIADKGGVQGPTNFAQSGAITIDYWIDDWQQSNDWGSYPLADVVTSTVTTVTSGVLDVTAAGAITVANDGTTSGSLDATGAAAITVAQPLYTAFSGALDATGAAAITVAQPAATILALDATGAASITVGTPIILIFSGVLDATGAASITVAKGIATSGAIAVTGAASITVAQPLRTAFSSSLDATGAAAITVAKGIAVSRPLDATGAAAITVAASLVAIFSGQLDATGAASLVVAASHVIGGGGAFSSGPLDVTASGLIVVNIPLIVTTRRADLDIDTNLLRMMRRR